jgi:hydroxyacylglutathione hydrolase
MDSARLFGLTLDSLPFVEHYLDDKQTIGIAGIDMKILETPGHAAGSLCFYAEKQNVIFTGDVLFMQSIGRTDLPTGNHKQLLENITTKLLSLPENTVVYPGHGQPTTIGEEKQFNPFF